MALSSNLRGAPLSGLLSLLLSLFSLEARGETQRLADFEDKEVLSRTLSTHEASFSLQAGAPETGGEASLKVEISKQAGTRGHFGAGIYFPSADLSKAREIRFWIRTDLKGNFNLQVHTGNRASVHGFATSGFKTGEWQELKAPVEGFSKAGWANAAADWSKIDRVQITFFQSGPYDGGVVRIDDIVAGSETALAPVVAHPEEVGPEKLGGPIHLDEPEIATPTRTPPPGYRSLFDGKTLTGWKAMPRLPVPKYPGAPFKMPLQGKALEEARNNVGKWTVEEGAIVGGQNPPGSGRGAYLVSEETFGDFELTMDMKPDWKVDSGFLVRTAPGGSPGMQILVDHRPQGGIGGFYGNGLAGLHAMPFAIDAEYDAEGRPIGMIAAAPDPERAELNDKTRGILQYAANVEDFLKVWKWGQWNTIKVRCEGRIPTLTTWVNGLKISELEMSTADWENYDAEACAEMLGRKGHISLEVHNSNLTHWLGKSRWWPGAVVRWKNIFIRELEPENAKTGAATPEPTPVMEVSDAPEVAAKASDVVTSDAATSDVATSEAAVDFSRDIRPILSSKCFMCHGPDANTREADLRLDDRDAAMEMGAIVAGAPDKSAILERILTDDPHDRMPPKGKPIPPAQVEKLRAWIAAGAPYEEHWAYVKPEQPVLPAVRKKHEAAISNPIDRFVLKRLAEKGMEPSPRAEPAVLLRRLSLDLIGLPPTLEEIERFEEDPSEAGYEREVDRLLASRHYGEKWALHWLDLARYADSNGYQHDDLRSMWPYRDWVVQALNEDLPFDRFTIEQLAGDLLPEPTQAQRIATGFHRNVATNFSGGSKVDEVRADILHDRVSTTGQVWLGMTMECSQCHDHKFDPIPQLDYYKLYAYFNQSVPELSTEGPGMFRKRFIGADEPYVTSPANALKLRQVEAEIEAEQQALEKAKPTALAGQAEWEEEFQDSGRADKVPWERFPWSLRGGVRYLKIAAEDRSEDERLNVEALLFYDHPATSPHEKALDLLKRERDSLVARTMVMKDAEETVPTYLFNRGDYTSPGPEVTAGVPEVLHPLDPELPANRLGLAKWIVDPENPLTARVTVNRFWAEIFGRGIVSTPEDFGMQSPPPTHPKLLDWLALEFIRQDWSMKQLIKTLVMSSTYRQTAAVPASKVANDPDNLWLARGPRFRLPAELLRDSLLAISGSLSAKIGGPAVYPPQPAGLWKEISGADVKVYPTSEGEDGRRRGIYTFLRRGNPNPMVLNFDGSNRSACVTSRDRSNTPVQALNLLNDPSYVEAAHSFAAWIEGHPGEDRDKAAAAFRRAVARQPSDQEMTTLLQLYADHGSWFSVAQVLLNLDETLTKS